jgi:hypothetical protein
MIAIACLRFLTMGPDLEPEWSFPDLNLCMTFLAGIGSPILCRAARRRLPRTDSIVLGGKPPDGSKVDLSLRGGKQKFSP